MKLERTPTSSGAKIFSREGSTFLPPLRRDGNTKAANKANHPDKAANATNNMKPIKIAISESSASDDSSSDEGDDDPYKEEDDLDKKRRKPA